MPEVCATFNRCVLYLALMASFGLPFFAWHLRKDVGCRDWLANHLVRVWRITLVISLATSLLALFTTASSMARGNVWPILFLLLSKTAFGASWLLRMFFLVHRLVTYRKRRAALSSPVNLLCSAIPLATLAWAGHGAMTEGAMGWLHLLADVSHLLASGAWAGVLIGLVMLCHRAIADDDPSAAMSLGMAAARFSRPGTLIVGTIVTAGLLNYAFILGPFLPGPHYALLLGLKAALIVPLLLMAAMNRWWLVPAFFRDTGGEGARTSLRKLRGSLTAELGFLCGVLTVVSILVQWDPGS